MRNERLGDLPGDSFAGTPRKQTVGIISLVRVSDCCAPAGSTNVNKDRARLVYEFRCTVEARGAEFRPL
jgi:hypothetical protein